MSTNERILSIEAVEELIGQFKKRHVVLIAANNAELERRRAAEAEVAQLRVDLTLTRNECARLRGVVTELACWVGYDDMECVAQRDRLLAARLPMEVSA